MRATKVKEVPYTVEGNMLRQARYPVGYDVEWRPNDPFEARLAVCEEQRGGALSHVWLVDEQGHEYPMWTDDLLHVLRVAGGSVVPYIGHGFLTGRWIARRRGFMYGLRLTREGE